MLFLLNSKFLQRFSGWSFSLWRCPKLFRYWHLIIDTINKTFQVNLNNNPWTCALGFLDEKVFTPQTRSAITSLLFLAHKCIVSKWLSSLPPMFEDWRAQANSSLLKEPHILQHRGTPHKCNQLWDLWLHIPGLAPLTLVSQGFRVYVNVNNTRINLFFVIQIYLLTR